MNHFMLLFFGGFVLHQALPVEMASTPLQCYSGTQNSLANMKFSTTTCSLGQVCYVVDVKQTVMGINSNTVVSSCLSQSACKLVTCDAVKQAMPAYRETVKECEVICCSSNFCLNADSSVSSTGSTTASPGSSNAISSTAKALTDGSLTSASTESSNDVTKKGNSAQVHGPHFAVFTFISMASLMFVTKML